MTKERRIEECTPEELSVEGIRKRSEAFNHWWKPSPVGFKNYDTLCVEVLLAEIERLRADAERYRWLRLQFDQGGCGHAGIEIRSAEDYNVPMDIDTVGDLDRVIDKLRGADRTGSAYRKGMGCA
jgi:hypothetical protein